MIPLPHENALYFVVINYNVGNKYREFHIWTSSKHLQFPVYCCPCYEVKTFSSQKTSYVSQEEYNKVELKAYMRFVHQQLRQKVNWENAHQ